MFDWENPSALGCKTVTQSLDPGAVIHYRHVLDDFDRYDYVNVASCGHNNGFIIGLRSTKYTGPAGYPHLYGPYFGHLYEPNVDPVAGDVNDQWTICIGCGRTGAGKNRVNFFLGPGNTTGRLGSRIEPNR